MRKTFMDAACLQVFERCDHGVIMLDHGGCVVYANMWLADRGWLQESFLGKPIADILPFGSPVLESLTEAYAKQSNQKTLHLEASSLALTHKVSQSTYYRTSISFISWSAQPMVFLQIHDMEDAFDFARLRLIEELQVQQAILSQQQAEIVSKHRLSTLGEMALGLGHEINNPLATIMTALHLASQHIDKGALDGVILKDYLERMNRMVHRIEKIVRGLKRFSRSQEQDPYVETAVMDILDDVYTMCFDRMSQAGIDFQFPIIPSSWYIACRPTEIGQVFLNLLINAYDAVMTQTQDRKIRITAEQIPEGYRFRVSNTGPSIPSDIREKLMQPFFTTKAPGKGSGLGLSICKGIIAAHQGALYLDPDVQETTFIVELRRSPV